MKDLLDRAWGLGFDDGVGYGTADVAEDSVDLVPSSPSDWAEVLMNHLGHTGSHRLLCGNDPHPDDEPLYGACLDWYGRGCQAGYNQTVGLAPSSSSSGVSP